MAEVKGQVIALDGERAIVRIMGEGCGRCHEPGGCGGAHLQLARAFCSAGRDCRVLNAIGAAPGDEVVIVIDDRALWQSALTGYGLPLLGLFAGAAAGLALAGEPGSMAGAAAGLIAALAVQRVRPAKNSLAIRRQRTEDRGQ